MAFPETRARRRTTVLGTVLASAALAFMSIGAAAQDETSWRSNYADPVPKQAMADMMAYCTEQTGVSVSINTLQHEDYQNTFSQAIQADPEDILAWFAGYRMRFFADQGLFSPVTSVWDEIGGNFSDAFKAASTGNDGEQYLVPIYNYPWVVIYRPSIFEANGWEIPATLDELMAIGDDALAKGIIPLAFADKQGWPAMGTFDILNMRINGYDFHVGLMAGEESWTDPRVKTVFETWKELTPYLQEGALGRDWQEAAQALFKGEAAMYFLGTFAGEQIPPTLGDGASQEDIDALYADVDFFPFPVAGTEFDAEMGIDAPIDGLVLSTNGGESDAAKAILACVGTGAAQDIFLAASPNNVAAANDADTGAYTPFQQRMVEIIAGSGAIAQFLDRDTRPDFAGPQGMQGFLQNFLDNPEQDLDAFLQGIQDFWDTLPPLSA
jgi:multiple sugar transport system substrate-binding protein